MSENIESNKSEALTPDQMAEIITFKISQATKDRIINILQPHFDRLADTHCHFDKKLADAILNTIKQS